MRRSQTNLVYTATTMPVEGVLLKRSDWLGRWDKRYFRLEVNRLVYYKEATDDAAKGEFIIEPTSSIESVDMRPHAFKICVAGKDTLLAAPSADDATAWMQSIQGIISEMLSAESSDQVRAAKEKKRDNLRAKYGIKKK